MRKLLRLRFAGLDAVATSLNSDHGGSPTPASKEWTLIEQIIKAPTLKEKRALFDQQAREHPVVLTLNDDELTVAAPTPMAEALRHLWRWYFRDRGWERMKQCSVCDKWFVDASNGQTGLRCSPSCTWAYWNANRKL